MCEIVREGKTKVLPNRPRRNRVMPAARPIATIPTRALMPMYRRRVNAMPVGPDYRDDPAPTPTRHDRANTMPADRPIVTIGMTTVTPMRCPPRQSYASGPAYRDDRYGDRYADALPPRQSYASGPAYR